ncbi:MAG: DinB family protein, partial [Bacteroidota bacterium]|nr:DinB family protein [Bacteroidota bacterium]
MNLEQLKYPIGYFQKPEAIRAEHLTSWIATIAEFPQKITALTKNLKEDALSKTYRPNGWTIRQLVHHCADSHINAF